MGTTFDIVPAGETVIAADPVDDGLAIEVAVTVATDVVVTVDGAV
jgi:hypothetical protein